MSRFEAGDKVRIIREDSTWSGTLKLYGKIGIINEEGAVEGLPNGARRWYIDDELELIEAAPIRQVSLRDQFAMGALTGLLAKGGNGCDVHPAHATHGLQLPKLAYAYADAMLKVRQL